MENNIGKRIAYLRKERGWSQMDLSKKLNVSDKAISKWENGGMPSVDLFPQLSKTFGVSIDYLMLGDAEEDFFEENDEQNDLPQDDFVLEESDFEQSIENLNIKELKLILDDQSDLYTKKELQFIRARYNTLLKESLFTDQEGNELPDGQINYNTLKGLGYDEIKKVLISKLPQNTTCPKCEAINTNPAQFCTYCGHDFIKADLKKYGFSSDSESTEKTSGAGCLGYFFALFFPIIGLILGIIKEDKAVITLSLVMMALNLISLIFCAALVNESPYAYTVILQKGSVPFRL